MTASQGDPDRVDDLQANQLHDLISTLMRQFKLEPGMLAGSAYADLHVNDIGLLATLAQPGDWTVRGVAQALSAPDSTISSALDRLESRKLICRRRLTIDRRAVGIELTAGGRRLATKLRLAQVENCRTMLERLDVRGRSELLALATQIIKR